MRVMLCALCGMLAMGSLQAAQTNDAANDTTNGEAGAIAVMSFNVRYNNPADGPNAWPHREEWVAEIIRENADIVGMQEVEKNQLDDLKRLLPNYSFYGVGRADGEDAGEFVPLAWRSERFSALEMGSFWLSETPHMPSKGWDAALKRVTSWVRLREKQSGQTLLVVNTHFDHRGEVARKKSAELLRHWIAEHRDGDPVVLSGDFNTGPKSAPYQRLTTGEEETALADTRLAVDDPQGPASTWNGFEKIVPGRRIDFLFTAGPIEVTSFRTIAKQRDGRFPSDHCPIVAVFTGL